MKNRTALVTGGAGFIGSHLVDHLLASGWKVRVLDDLSTGHLTNLAAVIDNIEFTQGCITDEAEAARAVAGVEVVFHLAAKVFVPESFEKPAEYGRVNVEGAAVMLAAARSAGVRRFVFSSTCAVYGDTTDLPIAETAPTKPLSPYAANKLAAEELGRKCAEHGGPAFTALRYFNVYGPRQDPRSAYSGVISKFADALKKGERPVIYGDGTQTRDFIHVSDVARANLLAALKNESRFAICNVGTGRETSINELLQLMAGAPLDAGLSARTSTGISAESNVAARYSSPPGARYLPARTGEVRCSVADVSLIRNTFSFSAQMEVASGVRSLLAHENANQQ